MRPLIWITAAICSLSGCKWGDVVYVPEDKCLGRATVRTTAAGERQYFLACPKVQCREPMPGAGTPRCEPVNGSCVCQGKKPDGTIVTRQVPDCHLKLTEPVAGDFKTEGERPYRKASCEGACLGESGKPTGKKCTLYEDDVSAEGTSPDGATTESKQRWARCKCQ